MNPIDDDAGGDRQKADTEFEEATPEWRDLSDPASHMARQDETHGAMLSRARGLAISSSDAGRKLLIGDVCRESPSYRVEGQPPRWNPMGAARAFGNCEHTTKVIQNIVRHGAHLTDGS